MPLGQTSAISHTVPLWTDFLIRILSCQWTILCHGQACHIYHIGVSSPTLVVVVPNFNLYTVVHHFWQNYHLFTTSIIFYRKLSKFLHNISKKVHLRIILIFLWKPIAIRLLLNIISYSISQSLSCAFFTYRIEQKCILLWRMIIFNSRIPTMMKKLQ